MKYFHIQKIFMKNKKKYISTHFEDPLSGDRLKRISLTQLHRIIPHRMRYEEMKDDIEERILDFFFF